jgi:hypothetical protein
MISDLRLKRAALLSRRVTPFHRRWDWGRRLATSIISASHASVNDESRGAPWSTGLGAARRRHRKHLGVAGREDPHPNPSIPSRQNMYTFTVVGAIRQAGSAASTVNRFYQRFDRLFSVKSPIMSDR